MSKRKSKENWFWGSRTPKETPLHWPSEKLSPEDQHGPSRMQDENGKRGSWFLKIQWTQEKLFILINLFINDFRYIEFLLHGRSAMIIREPKGGTFFFPGSLAKYTWKARSETRVKCLLGVEQSHALKMVNVLSWYCKLDSA